MRTPLLSLLMCALCACTTNGVTTKLEQIEPVSNTQVNSEPSPPVQRLKVANHSAPVDLKTSRAQDKKIQWANLEGLRPEYQLLMNSMRLAVCEAPQAKELSVPIAPELLLTTAGCSGEGYHCPLANTPLLIEDDEFFCPPIAQGRELNEASFVSTASVNELTEWYRQRLDEGYLEFRADDLETLFVREDATKINAIKQPTSSTSISIRFSEGIWNDAGYRSEVVVSQTPP